MNENDTSAKPPNQADFAKWLTQANEDLVESISGSLDVDDALAEVRYRALTEPDEALYDEHAAEMPGRFLDKVLSLSIIRKRRRPRTKATTERTEPAGSSRSKGKVAALCAAALLVVFPGLLVSVSGNSALLLSPQSIKEGFANLHRDDDAGGNDPGYAAPGDGQAPKHEIPPLVQPSPGSPKPWQPTSGSPTSGQPTTGQPATGRPAPGKPAPTAPAPGNSTPADPTPTETTLAVPAPGEPGPEPSSPAPLSVQSDMSVELSAQPGRESVEIDSWLSRGDGTNDLHMDPKGIFTTLEAKLSIVGDSPEPTYKECAQIINWDNRVDFAALHKGSHICALSSTGRYAVLKVNTLPAPEIPNSIFAFQGRTWQLPGQPPVVEPPSTQEPAPR